MSSKCLRIKQDAVALQLCSSMDHSSDVQSGEAGEAHSLTCHYGKKIENNLNDCTYSSICA